MEGGQSMKRYIVYPVIFFLIIYFTSVKTFAAEKINYDEGIKKVQYYIQTKDFQSAEVLLKELLQNYPDNSELLSILGRVLYWGKKYEESIAIYEKLLQIKPTEENRKEFERVQLAIEFQQIDRLLQTGNYTEAERKLEQLFEAQRGTYEAGYRLGMLYIQQHEYKKAIQIFAELKKLYPQDAGFRNLYMESLILDGEIKEAKKELDSLSSDEKEKLYNSRSDLFYRVRRNYIRAHSGFFTYSRGYKTERVYTVEMAQRISERTLITRYSNVFRFGRYNQQFGFDIYSKLGEKTKRWGYISGSYSPDRDFLPVWTLGGELYQGIKGIEISFGYSHMAFKNTSVNILIPGAIVYLPRGFALNERLYYVPSRGTYTVLSTFHYEPNHKFRAFYSFAIGTSSERIGAPEDVIKFSSYSHSIGMEYKLKPYLGLGIEYSFQHRGSLYDRQGWSFNIRYLW
jgi:YaiO family outer membrane protein